MIWIWRALNHRHHTVTAQPPHGHTARARSEVDDAEVVGAMVLRDRRGEPVYHGSTAAEILLGPPKKQNCSKLHTITDSHMLSLTVTVPLLR